MYPCGRSEGCLPNSGGFVGNLPFVALHALSLRRGRGESESIKTMFVPSLRTRWACFPRTPDLMRSGGYSRRKCSFFVLMGYEGSRLLCANAIIVSMRVSRL